MDGITMETIYEELKELGNERRKKDKT